MPIASPGFGMLSPLLLVAGDTALSKELLSLLVIALIAAAAPLVLGLLRLRLAEVVVLLAAGVVFGPHGLHWIVIDDAIELLAELGSPAPAAADAAPAFISHLQHAAARIKQEN